MEFMIDKLNAALVGIERLNHLFISIFRSLNKNSSLFGMMGRMETASIDKNNEKLHKVTNDLFCQPKIDQDLF